jgi:sulfatase modifying factor 1
MRFSNSVVAALSFLLGLAAFAGDARAITIDTVPVGNPGNAADPATGSLYGAVGYSYNIGTYDVTNAQYAAFLNAKAASDPLVLYDPRMGSNLRGGITQGGVSGSFVYTTKPNMDNKPVNYVNLYDTLRFANWLNNGQGNGSTETGAYTLSGGTAIPSNATSITLNADATWFLPSEDEWYKAAYYDPRSSWPAPRNLVHVV